MNKTIGVDKNITVLDKINFILDTTNNQNCTATPYKVASATIYFVSRDFTSNSVTEYEKSTFDDSLLKEFEKIKAETCINPTEENINKLNNIKIKLENSKYTSNFYFKEATPIKIFGSDEYPIWLNPDMVDISEREEVEENNILKPLIVNNQIIPGKFILEWDAYGNREGDYFICWHWKMTPLANLMSSHIMFGLLGETKLNTTIPTHFTKPEKYETLMERYLPSIFKSMLSDNDLSPQVLQELNYSVAKGFTFLEDMVNQIIDLFDSNVIQEPLLSLLSNLFDLQLRSNDSTLWRRQIKRAIPNYKKKGTKEGLRRALSDSGMKLIKLTNLWQVISKYTHQEMFRRIDANLSFTLERQIILYSGQPDVQNTEVYYRSSLSNIWEKLDLDYVSFSFLESESVYRVNWRGHTLPEEKRINLEIGDAFKIIYQFKEVPNLQEQNLENYIRMLDLMDQREDVFSSGYEYKVDIKSTTPSQLYKNFIRYNSSIQVNSTFLYISRSSISSNNVFEFFTFISAGDVLGIQSVDNSLNYQKFYITDVLDFSNDEYIKIPVSIINSSGDDFINNQNIILTLNKINPIYPPKNWNVKVIEQDDPLFDLIIPKRIPIQNPIVWGSVRTEFPYSENIYNMEEYNGSIRDSLNPCDIDKYFIEPCSDSPGSKISLDLEIEELSDDRILESQKIIEDYVPIHALIHSTNFIGSHTDLLKPPVELITALLRGSSEEILIAGEAQNIFNRSLKQIITPGDDLQNPILEDLSKPEIFYPLSQVRRTLLSNITAKTDTVAGVGSNKKIILYAPGVSDTDDLENSNNTNKLSSFDNYNINLSQNLLEILNSSNEGNYNIVSINKSSLEISGFINEFPLDKSQFEFRVSNKLYDQSLVNITKDYEYIFSLNLNASNLKIISQEDIDNNFTIGQCWKIKINESGYGCYDILKTLPNNKFILKGPILNNELINVSWELLDGNSCDMVIEGNEGELKIDKRAIVDLGPPINLEDDIRNIINIGDYLYYDDNQYKIKSFINNENYKFYIENYTLGNVGGVDIQIYRRIIENCVGNLDYQGLTLETTVDYEDLFKIQNGSNYNGIKTKTSDLKENYLILIDSNYYSILDIDGTTISLDGPYNEWKTTGSPVDFVIYQFINQPLSLEASYYPTLQAYDFDQIARSNNEVISGEVETLSPIMTIIKKILNSKPSNNEMIELSKQSESISIEVEHSDGNIEEKQL